MYSPLTLHLSTSWTDDRVSVILDLGLPDRGLGFENRSLLYSSGFTSFTVTTVSLSWLNPSHSSTWDFLPDSDLNLVSLLPSPAIPSRGCVSRLLPPVPGDAKSEGKDFEEKPWIHTSNDVHSLCPPLMESKPEDDRFRWYHRHLYVLLSPPLPPPPQPQEVSRRGSTNTSQNLRNWE